MEALFPQEVQPILMEMNNAGGALKKASRPTIYKGYKFLPGILPETLESFKEEYNLPENMVFIASFPKTGTTWTHRIVQQILCLKDQKTLQLLKGLPTGFYFMEMGLTKKKFEVLKYLPKTCLSMETHLTDEWFNIEKMKRKNGKIIYVLRNPKDQLVSWFHFAKNFTGAEMNEQMGLGDWNEYFQKCVNGIHPMGVKEGEWYPEHILGWLKYKDDKNMHIVVYEDMKKDLKREVARIAEFLEVKLSEEEIASVAQACTFQSMKAEMDKGHTETTKSKGKMGMLRKGEVGGWKNYFTVAQSEYIDKLFEEKLSHTGIKFTYEL